MNEVILRNISFISISIPESSSGSCIHEVIADAEAQPQRNLAMIIGGSSIDGRLCLVKDILAPGIRTKTLHKELVVENPLAKGCELTAARFLQAVRHCHLGEGRC